MYQLLHQARDLHHYLSQAIPEELAVINKLTPYMSQEFLIDLKKDLNNSLKLAMSKEMLSKMLREKINETCPLYAKQIESEDENFLPISPAPEEQEEHSTEIFQGSFIEELKDEGTQKVETVVSEDMKEPRKLIQKTFKRKNTRKPNKKKSQQVLTDTHITDHEKLDNHTFFNQHKPSSEKSKPKTGRRTCKKKIPKNYHKMKEPKACDHFLQTHSNTNDCSEKYVYKSSAIQNSKPWVAPFCFNPK
ncbi:hypothetical protein KR50_04190 [Jeotgalibacillus campisalis]|uniref:Uncharacterized protein n=2 Tax=Jeotgalibacillus campisalis TaxID=220754 RepID=A0A0C2RS81_9BACL|nr:hypothetical protein KR50_04190 [Jeotgalibacillus campisalis]